MNHKLIMSTLVSFMASSLMAAGPVFKTSMAEDENAFKAGQTAARKLHVKLKGVPPKALIVTECFEDKAQKADVLKGVASVFPKEIIHGGSAYGMYTQEGVLDIDAVSVLAIGGEVSVDVAFVDHMGAAGLSLETQKEQLVGALRRGGKKLAQQLPDTRGTTLLILIGDAHSPKNQYLLDGVQEVVGKTLPITGGSVCKNAGQNFVYTQGRLTQDSAIAILLTSTLKVSQVGRQAKSNDQVISTAREGAATAMKSIKEKPAALFAFDCGGRMGKLDRLEDELAAIQASVGKEVPLYGCYCAGEFGPADTAGASTKTPVGVGWHIMVSLLGN
ncbi:MAG: FIST C-terminal domain-containing protein [Phycisphaeraceae bacterium]|nr:FIST C-terminal domain-containing protein [Phycisphaeraceae bacterium]